MVDARFNETIKPFELLKDYAIHCKKPGELKGVTGVYLLRNPYRDRMLEGLIRSVHGKRDRRKIIGHCEIEYIGQSTDIYRRLFANNHHVYKFDTHQIFYIKLKPDELDRAESACIYLFKPDLNKSGTGPRLRMPS